MKICDQAVIATIANFSAIFIYSLVEYHIGKTGRRSLWAIVMKLIFSKGKKDESKSN